MNTTAKPKHIGRNISRIRELRGMKQEALAFAIGVSQQTISNIENSESIEDDKLVEIAKAMGVTPEAIKNFTEESIINYFTNHFNDSSSFNNQCTFNPLDKMVQLFEENKALHRELLQAEKDKVAYLEKLLNK